MRTFTQMGYATAEHAPGRRGWATALRAAHHAHLAHAAATRALRAEVPDAVIGIAHDVASLLPGTDSVADAEATVRYDGAMHRWFLDPSFGRGYPADLVEWYGSLGMLDGLDPAAVAGAPALDLLALNYYRRERIVASPATATWGIGAHQLPAVGELTGSGWEVHPEGFTEVLVRIAREYAPPRMAVTENGAGFGDEPETAVRVDDAARLDYLRRHVEAMADARAAGAPVVGYFAWSLLDNFEWAEGYATRFGIVHVDFATQRRTVKASGEWYRSFIAAGRGAAHP
jgi:beta-glucosidase